MTEEELKKTAAAGEPSREERDKHRALLAGVFFFMALIVVLWILNAATVFKGRIAESGGSFNALKFAREFEQTFNEVGERMSELKQINDADLERMKLEGRQFFSSSSPAVKTPPAIKK